MKSTKYYQFSSLNWIEKWNILMKAPWHTVTRKLSDTLGNSRIFSENSRIQNVLHSVYHGPLLSEILAYSRKLSDILWYSRIFSETLGYSLKHSDTLGNSWILSETLGYPRKLSEISQIWGILATLGVILGYSRKLSETLGFSRKSRKLSILSDNLEYSRHSRILSSFSDTLGLENFRASVEFTVCHGAYLTSKKIVLKSPGPLL